MFRFFLIPLVFVFSGSLFAQCQDAVCNMSVDYPIFTDPCVAANTSVTLLFWQNEDCPNENLNTGDCSSECLPDTAEFGCRVRYIIAMDLSSCVSSYPNAWRFRFSVSDLHNTNAKSHICFPNLLGDDLQPIIHYNGAYGEGNRLDGLFSGSGSFSLPCASGEVSFPVSVEWSSNAIAWYPMPSSGWVEEQSFFVSCDDCGEEE